MLILAPKIEINKCNLFLANYANLANLAKIICGSSPAKKGGIPVLHSLFGYYNLFLLVILDYCLSKLSLGVEGYFMVMFWRVADVLVVLRDLAYRYKLDLGVSK